MSCSIRLRALLSFGLFSVGWPASAQFISNLPFGQQTSVVTPLPFGQRSQSPIHPLATTATSLTVVAQWNMNETSGTVMHDSSGNGNNGALYNVQMTGSGYVFNGATSKAEVPNSPSFNPGTRDFSYGALVQTSRVPPAGGDYDVLRHGAKSTDGGGYRLEIENSKGIGKAYCSISDSTGFTLSVRGTTNVADGNLHNLTCTKNASVITLQVDSLAPVTRSGTLGSITNAKPFLVGVKAPSTTSPDADWYDGTLHGATVSIGS
jgi:hypothetical protein